MGSYSKVNFYTENIPYILYVSISVGMYCGLFWYFHGICNGLSTFGAARFLLAICRNMYATMLNVMIVSTSLWSPSLNDLLVNHPALSGMGLFVNVGILMMEALSQHSVPKWRKVPEEHCVVNNVTYFVLCMTIYFTKYAIVSSVS